MNDQRDGGGFSVLAIAVVIAIVILVVVGCGGFFLLGTTRVAMAPQPVAITAQPDAPDQTESQRVEMESAEKLANDFIGRLQAGNFDEAAALLGDSVLPQIEKADHSAFLSKNEVLGQKLSLLEFSSTAQGDQTSYDARFCRVDDQTNTIVLEITITAEQGSLSITRLAFPSAEQGESPAP